MRQLIGEQGKKTLQGRGASWFLSSGSSSGWSAALQLSPGEHVLLSSANPAGNASLSIIPQWDMLCTRLAFRDIPQQACSWCPVSSAPHVPRNTFRKALEWSIVLAFPKHCAFPPASLAQCLWHSLPLRPRCTALTCQAMGQQLSACSKGAALRCVRVAAAADLAPPAARRPRLPTRDVTGNWGGSHIYRASSQEKAGPALLPLQWKARAGQMHVTSWCILLASACQTCSIQSRQHTNWNVRCSGSPACKNTISIFSFQNRLNSAARQGSWSWCATFLWLLLCLIAPKGAVQSLQSSLSKTLHCFSALECQLFRFYASAFSLRCLIWCCAKNEGVWTISISMLKSPPCHLAMLSTYPANMKYLCTPPADCTHVGSWSQHVYAAEMVADEFILW